MSLANEIILYTDKYNYIYKDLLIIFNFEMLVTSHVPLDGKW